MRNGKITIDDCGMVTIPNEVRMRDFEIADMFGVYTQTIRTNIRTILKSGAIRGNVLLDVTIAGNTLIPELHNLEMIIALAFRIRSRNTEIFRQWLIRRAVKQEITATFVMPLQKAQFN